MPFPSLCSHPPRVCPRRSNSDDQSSSTPVVLAPIRSLTTGPIPISPLLPTASTSTSTAPPLLTAASSSSFPSVATPPPSTSQAVVEEPLRFKAFPHSADLLGGRGEASAASSRTVVNPIALGPVPSPDNVPAERQLVPLSELAAAHPDSTGDVAPQRTPPTSRVSSSPIRNHRRRRLSAMQLRPEVDPPHLAALDRDFSYSSVWNELGLDRISQRSATSFRPRIDHNHDRDTEATAASGPSSASYRTLPPVTRPPVRRSGGRQIPSYQSTLSTTASDTQHPQRQFHNMFPFTNEDGSIRSEAPSVPPPRPSPFHRGSFPRVTEPIVPSNFIPLQRANSIGTAMRSRFLHNRLAQLDNLRAEAERQAPAPRADWIARPIWPPYSDWLPPSGRQHDNASDLSAHGTAMEIDEVGSTTTVTSSVPGTLAEFLPQQEMDTDTLIGEWNRNVNDAISGRLIEESTTRTFAPPSNAATNSLERLWGEIPIDTVASGFHDPQHPFTQLRNAPRPRLFGSRVNEYSSMFGLLGMNPAQIDVTRELDIGRGWTRQSLRDAIEAVPLPPEVQGEGHWPPLEVPPPLPFRNPFVMMEISKDMSPTQKERVTKMVLKYASRLGSDARQKAAETVLAASPWSELVLPTGIAKDHSCSVCHDDYTPEIKVAVTPCNHMYHQECLNTWLTTPNISSCPMCRRDLAGLAILSKLVWSKKREDALPLWLAA